MRRDPGREAYLVCVGSDLDQPTGGVQACEVYICADLHDLALLHAVDDLSVVEPAECKPITIGIPAVGGVDHDFLSETIRVVQAVCIDRQRDGSRLVLNDNILVSNAWVEHAVVLERFEVCCLMVMSW